MKLNGEQIGRGADQRQVGPAARRLEKKRYRKAMRRLLRGEFNITRVSRRFAGYAS